jgi:hypothetical protein
MLLPIAMLVSACQVGGPKAADPAAPAAGATRDAGTNMTARQSTGGPMIATYRPERPKGGIPASALALVEGRLAELDGCLVIAREGGVSVQPVFPDGSARWDEGARRLIFNGAAYRIGDKITVGGGGVGDEAKYSARPGVSIPQCRAGSLFIVSL